jgi:hypothetical protein
MHRVSEYFRQGNAVETGGYGLNMGHFGSLEAAWELRIGGTVSRPQFFARNAEEAKMQ